MSFTPRKYQDIFDEMRAKSKVVTDFEVGSVARTMYESFAYEMALLYEKMQLVYLSAYVDSAQDNQLDQVVAILGIERSQPDFAEGVVSFQREEAGQEILIPIGTLVSTAENAKGNKIVFQTTKEAILDAAKTSVDAKIRGVERGEQFETTARTVVVMPRPVPGIKAVTNTAPVRLVGKRRETDEELRSRAKNALISSGKATILSVENALLSLSGVRDVKVKENFLFAKGRVKFTNTSNANRMFPKGTILTLKDATPGASSTLSFRTLDPIGYIDSEASPTEKEVVVEALIKGKAGEYTPPVANPALTFQNSGLGAGFTATLTQEVRLKDFGQIQVYVDAPRLEKGTDLEIQSETDRIMAEIERVRAAGIFTILKPAGKVEISAVFKIDLPPSLTLSPEERKQLEGEIADGIVSLMGDLRMGKPLLYGKLVKTILSMANVENVADFRGTFTRRVLGSNLSIPFSFSDPDKFVAVDEFERIKPRFIAVATENKTLKVSVAYQSTGLDQKNADAVRQALQSYFVGKALGATVFKSEIKGAITAALATPLTLNASSLDLLPESWSPGAPDDPRPLMIDANGDTSIVATYVEKPDLGTLFGYAVRLEITGAIKLVMPLNASEGEQLAAKKKVTEAIAGLMARLGPEEPLTYDAMVAAAQAVPQVLAAVADPKDFRAVIGAQEQPTQVSQKKIDVKPLQRAFPGFLCISANVEKVMLSVQAIRLSMASGASAAIQSTVQSAVANAFNNALSGFKAGDSIPFPSLKGALENLVAGTPYTLTQLDIQAVSQSDQRTQAASIGSPVDIHIRSIELAILTPLLSSNVSITLI